MSRDSHDWVQRVKDGFTRLDVSDEKVHDLTRYVEDAQARELGDVARVEQLDDPGAAREWRAGVAGTLSGAVQRRHDEAEKFTTYKTFCDNTAKAKEARTEHWYS